MSEAPATFSESWYRVASQRLALRSTVRARRQLFRGERWIVLEDPFSNQFFRVRPEVYEFLGRLRPDRTVEEVWKECFERFPATAPGQEAVIRILAQLYHSNLLQYPMAVDAAELFRRFEKTRQREIRSRLLNIMFARFPLLDPDRFLISTLPWIGKLISPAGAVLWMAVVGWALKVAADHAPSLRDQAQSVIAPDNLFLLYTGLVIVKTLHEFGHAYFCRHFGGEVHVMGVLLMIFTPVPYMDATSAWGFRERSKRVLVGAAGMIVELYVAALATFVWAGTGVGVVHNLAYNIMLVASVSTLLFNLNPLLRFDGYYILSDLIGIPNLTQRSMQQLRMLAERHLFGLRKSEGPATTRSEAVWLSVFGSCSGIYRVFLFAGILLVIADQFLLLGLIMAAICAVVWLATPIVRLSTYLASNPSLGRHRPRAIAVTLALVSLVLVFLQFIPFPSHFRAPGVIQSRQWMELHSRTAGRVTRLLAQPGGYVKSGQPLVQMENPEIEIQLTGARAGLVEVETRIRQALHESTPNLKPLESLKSSMTKTIERLERERSDLTVRASQDGLWLIPESEGLIGRWMAKGGVIGALINTNGFQFQATILQEDGDRLFHQPPKTAEVRLSGEAGRRLGVGAIRVIPGEQRQLPSAALGWRAGGPVPTATKDNEGRQAAEPFFEVNGDVTDPAGAALLHGRAGWIRFDLPNEPLLPRWIRSLRQLLQTRYQV
jgi:putative peptide zinc metalloprotease protein